MWTRALLRAKRLPAHRKAAFTARKYNGQSQGPHRTYFQPSPEPPRPPRRILRSILFGTTIFGVGAYAHAWLLDIPFLGLDIDTVAIENVGETALQVEEHMVNAAHMDCARYVVPLIPEAAQALLEQRASCFASANAVEHACQLPSNLPCEDTFNSGYYKFADEPAGYWAWWGLFDGHAGPRTSHALKDELMAVVCDGLLNDKCMNLPDTPSSSLRIIKSIKDAFVSFDNELHQLATQRAQDYEGDLSWAISGMAPYLSGSCALVALLDPAKSVLRVANVGDSRAVLGRWDDAAGKYIARPLSVDQTGFNQDEVERLKQEHPHENPVDPQTGRVHGIMVSRAFGDSRWKWPQELSQLVHDKFWGPKPRPAGMIQTPPYLTAEPDVREEKVRLGGAHPDFLIMASDGLWDLMSSEDAITCVNMWLDRYNPDVLLSRSPGSKDKNFSWNSTKFPLANTDDEEDMYFDEKEGVLKWQVSPKHFVVEDENCGVHLIKNALGGKRGNLFRGLLSLQPPLSRDVRDDITVQVVFFGDFQNAIPNTASN